MASLRISTLGGHEIVLEEMSSESILLSVRSRVAELLVVPAGLLTFTLGGDLFTERQMSESLRALGILENATLGCIVRSVLSGASVGMKIGCSYSCVGVHEAFLQNGDSATASVQIVANDQGNRTTPSYVTFTDAEILIGDAAKSWSVRTTEGSFFSTMRWMGEVAEISLDEDRACFPFKVFLDASNRPSVAVTQLGVRSEFTIEALTGKLGCRMVQFAEQYVPDGAANVVVTSPARFKESQRQSLRNSLSSAGLNVIQVIEEPIAAAMAYGLDKCREKEHILVFQLGGSSLTVSILYSCGGCLLVKETASDLCLGGNVFRDSLLNKLAEQFYLMHKKDLTVNARAVRRLEVGCERAVRCLTQATFAIVEIDSLFEGIDYEVTVQRTDFEELIHNDISRCILFAQTLIARATLTADTIHEVVLAGGSTQIPILQRKVAELFPGKRLLNSIPPDEVCAYGASLEAAVLSGLA